ncbi:hypothetical protein SLS57_007055 [Botryosphaeria dothidea]
MSDQATDPTAADGALATQGQAHDEHAASNAHEEHHATRPKHEDASAAPQHPPSTAASASQPAQPLQRPDAASINRYISPSGAPLNVPHYYAFLRLFIN